MSATIPTLDPARLGGMKRWRRPVAVVAIGGTLIVLAAQQCQVSGGELIRGGVKLVEVAAFFFPPALSALPELIGPACVTILLAAIATPFGVALSLAFGIAGAKNLSPRWLRNPARSAIAVERALPELITLLLLVAALGVGTFPGIVALAIGSIGMLGKLFADAIEEIDPRVLEAVESVGATRWQVIRHAVIPEVLPALLTNSLFRFEVNIRASVILGAAGAGGIGEELYKAMGLLEYERASMAILLTLALVLAAERGSDFLRRRVLDGGRLK